jgi:hypothetical protein
MTSTVVPRFSKSAPSGMSLTVNWMSAPWRTVKTPSTMSMGDWRVPVAHTPLAGDSSAAQLSGP